MWGPDRRKGQAHRVSLSDKLSESTKMKKIMGTLVAVAVLAVAGIATAGDITGTIKSVAGRVVTLTDGKSYTVPAAVAGTPDMMGGLGADNPVQITFTTDAAGVNQVSKIGSVKATK